MASEVVRKLQIGPLVFEVDSYDEVLRELKVDIYPGTEGRISDGLSNTRDSVRARIGEADWVELGAWAAQTKEYDSLFIDEQRLSALRLGAWKETGIPIRARHASDGRYENVDLAALSIESVQSWLRSRGGVNRWAENAVLVLLGFEPDVIKALMKEERLA